ncbi:hypothetical protein [Emticicia fontis]
MKKLLLVAIALLFELNVYAQTRVIQDERGELITEFDYLTQRVVRYRGSIFLKDSVELGTFSVAGGQVLQKPVLFDMLNQNFLAYMGDKFVSIKNTDLQLGNHHLKYIRGGYYETYYDAKVKILIRYGCTLKTYDKNSKVGILPQFASNYSGEVIHKKYYYLQFPDKKLREISLNNYSVTLALAKQYDGLTYHIRQWNRDIRTEKDVADLLDYLSKDGML